MKPRCKALFDIHSDATTAAEAATEDGGDFGSLDDEDLGLKAAQEQAEKQAGEQAAQEKAALEKAALEEAEKAALEKAALDAMPDRYREPFVLDEEARIKGKANLEVYRAKVADLHADGQVLDLPQLQRQLQYQSTSSGKAHLEPFYSIALVL